MKFFFIGMALGGMTLAGAGTARGAGEAAPPPTAQYAVRMLGALGGNMSEANAINASGQVAGWASTAQGQHHAFLYSGGKMQDLGTLGGDQSEATALNNWGRVVGWAEPAPGAPGRAFLSDDKGRLEDLGNVVGNISRANAINDAGQIVGEFTAPTLISFNLKPVTENRYHAFLYGHGQMQDLSAALYWASGINSTGTVIVGSTGVATPPDGIYEIVGARGSSKSGKTSMFGYFGARWSDGTAQIIGFPAGAELRMANAINNTGQIVGELEFSLPAIGTPGGPSDVTHAFLSKSGQLQDLGTLGGKFSGACAINNPGQVVGWAADAKDKKGAWLDQRAILYNKGQLQDLNALVGDAPLAAAGFKVLLVAKGINDAGQIVGYGEDLAGHHQAFLLTPTKGK